MRFREFLSGTSVFDRNLDQFQAILGQLNSAADSVEHPEAKEEISELVNDFNKKMKKALEKYQYKGLDGTKHFGQPTMSLYAPLG